MSSASLALLFSAVSATFNLPDGLLSAISYVESRHRIITVGLEKDGGYSLGLCQVKHMTAKYMGFSGDEDDLMRPEINAYYAGKYLRYQLDRYNQDVDKAVAAYNAGHYAVNSYGQIMNRKYVYRVRQAWSEGK